MGFSFSAITVFFITILTSRAILAWFLFAASFACLLLQESRLGSVYLHYFQNGWNDIVRVGFWCEIIHHATILVDDELGEVPWNWSSFKFWVYSKVLVGHVCIRAVNLCFTHYWEWNVIFLCELLDLSVGAWLLLTKLVARVANYLQTLRAVSFIDGLQLFEVLFGITSFWSDVDNKCRLCSLT